MASFSFPITVVAADIAYIYFFTVLVFIDRWFGLGSSPGIMNVVVFTVVAIICVSNYVLAIFTDPGLVPFSFSPDIEDSHNPIHEIKRKEENVSSSQESSPLGLKLTKTSSLINLLEKKLSQTRKSVDQEVSLAKLDSEKLKASNFPATLLKIGNWESLSRNEGGLIAKCYYAKKKIVWEILDGSLKSKIELHWSAIVGIKAVLRDNESGILEIELDHPPVFFRETNPQPRKHTAWVQAEDFTGGQAPIYRRHYVVFPPGVLDRHYEKLLQCDKRLSDLSKKPFPTQNSPFFYASISSFPAYSPDFNGNGTVFAAEIPYHVPKFPALVVTPHIVHNYKATTSPPFVIVDSTSPMSVMEFPHLDGTAPNCAIENQMTMLWSTQGVNNNQGQSSMPMTAQGNQGFPYQDFPPMNSVENSGTVAPINEIPFSEIEKHLLDDSEVVCLDDNELLESIKSMHSFLEQEALNNDNNNVIANALVSENENENFGTNHFLANTNDYSGVNDALVFLPPQDSNVNNMMMNPPTNQPLSPYAFSEPTVDDFAALGSSLNIRLWG